MIESVEHVEPTSIYFRPDGDRQYRASQYLVRLFDHRGRYPNIVFSNRDALFWAGDNFVFSVCYCEPWAEELPYSGVSDLLANEIRLLASLLLCEQSDHPKFCFYPYRRSDFALDCRSIDLQQPGIGERVAHLLRQTAVEAKRKGGEFLRRYANSIEAYANTYDLLELEPDFFNRADDLWRAIETTDYVTLRGIHALLKSEMLFCHSEFEEEATMMTFIALECSFQLVIRALKTAGISNPDSIAAGKWIHDTFNEPFGIQEWGKYYGDYYEQRVMAFHPQSRYGTVPFAPIDRSDFMTLRRELREVFAYISLGEHGPDFERELDEFKRRQVPEQDPQLGRLGCGPVGALKEDR